MTMNYLLRKNAPKLAYCFTPALGAGADLPMVFFMGGFKSDMDGTKAVFLEDICKKRGQAYLRFDYRGHGASDGLFEDGTIGLWAQDARDILDHITAAHGTTGPVILVGSSMGGWIALLILLACPAIAAGMIGIAAAPDFTQRLYDTELSEAQRRQLNEKGRLEVPNAYSDAPYIFTKTLFEDGEAHFLLNKKHAVNTPIILLQGMQDTAVPWETTDHIKDAFAGCSVTIHLIPDGDHRLSRPEDLQRLEREVYRLSGAETS